MALTMLDKATETSDSSAWPPEIAAEFARLKVDAIVTVGGEAAKQATSSIPIVAALMADPLGQGLVSNLARPGGNVTGLSIQSSDLAGKRLPKNSVSRS